MKMQMSYAKFLNQKLTFMIQELVPQSVLPDDFVRAIKNIDYKSVWSLHWQLSFVDTYQVLDIYFLLFIQSL